MHDLSWTFDEVVSIIETARSNAFRKVNEELILMYMNVGRFLSEKTKDASYGDGYVSVLADYIQQKYPGIKGFTRRGLYRMKQFYELYAGNEKVSTLLTQLNWSNHLLIMSGAKTDEEREFYMRLSIKDRYSYRELERQVKKSDENPSVGLLLCASKNDEVVEYAMSRTLSPMMVAEYQLHLPDKDVLRKKLQEFVNLPVGD